MLAPQQERVLSEPLPGNAVREGEEALKGDKPTFPAGPGGLDPHASQGHPGMP